MVRITCTPASSSQPGQRRARDPVARTTPSASIRVPFTSSIAPQETSRRDARSAEQPCGIEIVVVGFQREVGLRHVADEELLGQRRTVVGAPGSPRPRSSAGRRSPGCAARAQPTARPTMLRRWRRVSPIRPVGQSGADVGRQVRLLGAEFDADDAVLDRDDVCPDGQFGGGCVYGAGAQVEP